jgi:hypothetical protein
VVRRRDARGPQLPGMGCDSELIADWAFRKNFVQFDRVLWVNARFSAAIG